MTPLSMLPAARAARAILSTFLPRPEFVRDLAQLAFDVGRLAAIRVGGLQAGSQLGCAFCNCGME
jgi:hypothetical protein